MVMSYKNTCSFLFLFDLVRHLNIFASHFKTIELKFQTYCIVNVNI